MNNEDLQKGRIVFSSPFFAQNQLVRASNVAFDHESFLFTPYLRRVMHNLM